jgi:hypothetical protein
MLNFFNLKSKASHLFWGVASSLSIENKVGLPVTVPAQPGRQSFRCSKDSDFPSWLMSFSFFQFSWPYDQEAWSSHRDLERREKEM